jgi:hypothetical protein
MAMSARIRKNLEPPADVCEAPEPADSARVAMRVLLARALTDAATDYETVGRDGVVVVVSLPDLVWTDLAAEVWKAVARNDQAYDDGYRNRWGRAGGWRCYAPSGTRAVLYHGRSRRGRCDGGFQRHPRRRLYC